MKYFNSQVAAVAASAIISLNGVPPDGATVTVPAAVLTFAAVDPGGVTWIDTSSADTSVIAGLVGAAMPSGQFSNSVSGVAINLTWLVPGSAANANTISTSDPTNISVTGFFGGVDGGSADGNYANLVNFWNDSGNTIPAGAVPLSSDDVTNQESPVSGAGVAQAMSGSAVAGATITCASCSAGISSGAVTTNAFTGPQSGGAVTLTGASATYTPSAKTGGTMTTDGSVTTLVYNDQNGDSFAITAPTLPAAQYVLGTTYGGPYGSATLPDPTKVKSGEPDFGVGGNGSHPSYNPPSGGASRSRQQVEI